MFQTPLGYRATTSGLSYFGAAVNVNETAGMVGGTKPDSGTGTVGYAVVDLGFIPFGSGTINTYTTTATVDDRAKVRNPGLVARFLLAGDINNFPAVRSDETQLGPDASVTTTATRDNVSSRGITLDPSVSADEFLISANLTVGITTETVDSSQTSTYAKTPPVGAAAEPAAGAARPIRGAAA